MQNRQLLLLAATTGLTLSAQDKPFNFSFGARAGFLLNQSGFEQTIGGRVFAISRVDSNRFLGGPTVEVGWKNRLALEVSPTYRRIGRINYNDISNLVPTTLGPGEVNFLSQLGRETGQVWDIPLVGKYYFAPRNAKLRPFVGGGVAASRLSLKTEVFTRLQGNGGPLPNEGSSFQRATWGISPILNGGVSIRSGRISIVPEFRYIRDSNRLWNGTRHRAEVFLGFRF